MPANITVSFKLIWEETYLDESCKCYGCGDYIFGPAYVVRIRSDTWSAANMNFIVNGIVCCQSCRDAVEL